MPITDTGDIASSHLPMPQKRILNTWWPLAAGWLLMTVEVPILAAFIARLPEPEINLAAWGVAFPIALLLGAPALVLLATSTALSKDWDSYQRLRRFTLALIAILTGLHIAIAYTPLYDFIVHHILSVPAELIEPARTGIRIMSPFVGAVAFRRLNNGVLIRFGHSRAVTLSAVTRLSVDILALSIFQFIPNISGIVLATATITAGVCGEVIYSSLRVRPVLKNQLCQAPPQAEPLTLNSLLHFYTPLVMTTMLQVLIQPIVAAALSRLPDPISSLAVWPVLISMVSVISSSAHAYVETVVVLLDEPRALNSLYRFTAKLSAVLFAILFIFNITPLSNYWFQDVAALPGNLVTLARQSLWFLSLTPTLMALDALSQGALMNGRKTRSITESVILSLLLSGIVMSVGIALGRWPGLTVCLLALVSGAFLRTSWLWRSSRPILHSIQLRDAR